MDLLTLPHLPLFRAMFQYFPFFPTEGADMKVGLLVVLAVAVLVPSLSQGRTVSECELREKLREVINLPRRLQKYKENILAIGEVNQWWVGCPEV